MEGPLTLGTQWYPRNILITKTRFGYTEHQATFIIIIIIIQEFHCDTSLEQNFRAAEHGVLCSLHYTYAQETNKNLKFWQATFSLVPHCLVFSTLMWCESIGSHDWCNEPCQFLTPSVLGFQSPRWPIIVTCPGPEVSPWQQCTHYRVGQINRPPTLFCLYYCSICLDAQITYPVNWNSVVHILKPILNLYVRSSFEILQQSQSTPQHRYATMAIYKSNMCACVYVSNNHFIQ